MPAPLDTQLEAARQLFEDDDGEERLDYDPAFGDRLYRACQHVRRVYRGEMLRVEYEQAGSGGSRSVYWQVKNGGLRDAEKLAFYWAMLEML